MKNMTGKILAVTTTIIVIMAAILYVAGDRIALALVCRQCNITIAYGQMRHESFRRFDFTDFAFTDAKTGIGLRAQKAVITPSWKETLTGKLSIGFTLSGVSFIKQQGEKQDDYDTFEGLAAAPFNSRWTYLDLSGALQSSNGDIHLQDLKATSDVIKFDITGDFRNDATIDADITIYFSDSLFSKIPKQFIKGVLKEEGDGWKSFAMKLSGNYKSPSIQVTGKLFRLNVGIASR